MNGALFYSSRYGSTAQYAAWISEATGIPIFNMQQSNANPADYDFLVLGFPVIYHNLFFHQWIDKNQDHIADKPLIVFTVSGAPAGAKLDSWIANSLPEPVIARMSHIALRGRQKPKELTLFDRLMLNVGGRLNRNPVAAREEREGFDYVDKSSIEPVNRMIGKLQSTEKVQPQDTQPVVDRHIYDPP